jgi:formylglycine-generating enzyme required for sulfatase activity
MPDESKSQTGSGEALSPGSTLLGVYEILGVLGGGGMGRVYRAQHNQLGVLRAIKVIRPDLTSGSNAQQQFVREARVLMEINHDAVARCHELLSDADGCLYLVMELVEGPSLETLIQAGPLDVGAVRALWQRIAEGLAAIHAKGIVHRDISPGNIVLPGSRPERAKLIDFGVASLAAAETIGMGEFKGKLAYASPEQLGQYGGKVEGKSDIYTFGLVLAEAASGNKTYRTPYETRLPANVPAELKDDILRLLEPDPALRPDNGFPAPPKSVKDTVKTQTINRPIPVAVAPAPVAARQSGASAGVIALIAALVLCIGGFGAWQFLKNKGIEDDKPRTVAILPPRTDGTKNDMKKDSPPKEVASTTPIPTPTPTVPKEEAPKSQPEVKSALKKAVADAPVKKPDPPVETKRVPVNETAPHTPAPVTPKKVPQAGDSKVNLHDGLNYVWIPPGAFMMGCSPRDNECSADERPVHAVTITKGFRLGQTDVTQAAYQRVTGANPSKFQGSNLPVENVTWDMAGAYCRSVGGRLPTEAEWEYAARAGTTGARYGNLDDIAWYSGNSGAKTHEVGQKQPNAFELYDMLGNVYQWTSDWHGERYYDTGESRDPAGPPGGSLRILRGGSWFYTAKNARASYRHRFEPTYHSNQVGLRCVTP